MKKKNVVIFGDSLLRGVIINEETQKYTFSKSINWAEIEKELNVSIVNNSKMGATITYGCEKFAQFLASSESIGVDTVVIEYGGNDSDYFWKEISLDSTKTHHPKTNLKTFEHTLNKMINMAIKKGIKPVLMNLPPISSIKYYKWIMRDNLNEKNIMHHLKDVETIARHQELYNNIIMQTAFKRNVDLVDIRKEFLNTPNYMALMCEDGIHPNIEGGNLIIKTFINKFKPTMSIAN